MQAVDAELSAVFALPGTGLVWAVGDGGLIVHSADGGTTWAQQNPQREESDPARDAPAGAWRWPSVVEPAWAERPPAPRAERSAAKGAVRVPEAARPPPPRGPVVSRSAGRPLARAEGILLRQPLRGVTFADAQHGWAWGDWALLETRDGGASWRIAAESELAIVDVAFAGSSGWIIGRDWLSHSGDRGETWSLEVAWGQVAGATGPWAPRRIRFLDEQHGWVIGEEGLFVTRDGGKRWRGAALPRHAFQLVFSDPSQGWLSTHRGDSFSTRDGGITWTPAAEPVDADGYLTRGGAALRVVLSGDSFAESDRGAVIWRSDPVGLHARASAASEWTTRLSTFDSQGLDFVDPQRGWVRLGARLLETGDGGESWRLASPPLPPEASACPKHLVGWARFLPPGLAGPCVDPPVPTNTRAVWLLDATRSFAVTPAGVVATTDGGDTWTSLYARRGLRDVTFASDGLHGWAVADRGRIYATSDGGQTWERQTSPTAVDLRGVHFLDPSHGFVVGAQGTLLETNDGGGAWTVRPLEGEPELTRLDLRAVEFVDAQHGWLAAGTALLRTSDGGASWQIARYRRYPAPWYWVVCLGAVALAWPRRQEDTAVVRQSVADVLASDRPIGWKDPDPLGFRDIALGISRFIRNDSTEPPLTMAITGPWGSGKSSLMTLLKEDLARRGFRPVWFNAWHHQKGEHLLAALSANILGQGVPAFFTPRGLPFRVNLVWLRSWRRRAVAGALAFGAMALAAYLAAKPGRGAALLALLPSAEELKEMRTLDDVVTTAARALSVLVPSLAGLVPLWRSLRAFGVDPTKLKNATGAGAPGAQGDPGARQHFAREFGEVTRALHPRTMVIFIDDLDRCSKEHVVEVLEAINFLVSSGECVVVFAMAREWVESCVALAFDELSQQAPSEPGESPEQRRLEFARNYLEKLINIEVPVPALDEAGSEELLVQRNGLRESWRSWLAARAADWAAVSLVVALAIAGAWLGGRVGWDPKQPALAPAGAPAAPLREVLLSDGTLQVALPLHTEKADAHDDGALVLGEVPLAGSHTASLVIARDAAGRAFLQLQMPPVSAPPAADAATVASAGAPDDEVGELFGSPALSGTTPVEPPRFGVALPLAALLAVGLAALLQLATSLRVVEKDSPEFRDALRVWHKVIVAAKPTPRTIKRYLNRVRYLAMRLRSEPEPFGLLARLRTRWKLRGREIFAEPTSPSDPNLVALAALHVQDPSQVESGTKLASLFSEPAETGSNELARATARAHRARFAVLPSESDRVRFLRILAAVRTG